MGRERPCEEPTALFRSAHKSTAYLHKFINRLLRYRSKAFVKHREATQSKRPIRQCGPTTIMSRVSEWHKRNLRKAVSTVHIEADLSLCLKNRGRDKSSNFFRTPITQDSHHSRGQRRAGWSRPPSWQTGQDTPCTTGCSKGMRPDSALSGQECYSPIRILIGENTMRS